ncbi:MAG: cytochrome c3 family protein [Acidobacteria bacterium]|nr:cytochrome c3 family protein [Acidobacteriota bacterium]
MMRRKILWVCWCGIIGAMGVPCRGAGTAQPIPFNHKIHTVDNEFPCDTCHRYVFEKPFAGLPPTDLCIQCHEDDITTNPAAAPHIQTIRRHAKEGTEIPWVRLYVLPKTVYYSHRRHAKIAGLECSVCHGDIGRSETPPARPIARTLDMDHCIKCHVERKAEYDCSRCHR